MKGGGRWKRGGRGEGNAADERRGASENEEVCDCSETRDAWRGELLLRPSCQRVWLLGTSARRVGEVKSSRAVPCCSTMLSAVLHCSLRFTALLLPVLLYSLRIPSSLQRSLLFSSLLPCSPFICCSPSVLLYSILFSTVSLVKASSAD